MRRTKPGTFLRTAELADRFGSRRAVESALSRVARSDEPLVHVRNGLYWRSPNSRFGKAKPRPVSVALALCAGGVGPAGWTALRTLGLSTQVPAEDELAVVGSPPAGVDGIKFCSRNNFARHTLRYHEIATLESLRTVMPETPEWDNLIKAVGTLGSSKKINLRRIARAALNEPPKVRRAAGALLTAVNSAREA